MGFSFHQAYASEGLRLATSPSEKYSNKLNADLRFDLDTYRALNLTRLRYGRPS